MKVVSGHLTTRVVESAATAQRRTGRSKTARLQQALAAHFRDLLRAYPPTLGKPVFIPIDTAPWHRGEGIAEVLAAHPHLPL